jgi:hypothetical protein
MKGQKMKIYGWIELNECSHSTIYMWEVAKDAIQILDEITGEVTGKSICDIVYQEGRFFTTFRYAKRAMIDELKQGINWRQKALEKTQQLKKFKRQEKTNKIQQEKFLNNK